MRGSTSEMRGGEEVQEVAGVEQEVLRSCVSFAMSAKAVAARYTAMPVKAPGGRPGRRGCGTHSTPSRRHLHA